MKGKSQTLLFITSFIGLFNLISNVILVPKYGLEGAAFATSLSLILFCLILIIQTKKYLNIIPLRRKMFKILIISLIPTFFLILIKDILEQNLTILMILGLLYLLIYIFLIFITNCLDKNDFLIVNIIKNKFK